MAAGRPPRVASSQEVGSHLVSVCCLPKDGPEGSPAAARMRAPRREGPRTPLYEIRSCKLPLPKSDGETCGLHSPFTTLGAGRSPYYPSRGPPPRSSNFKHRCRGLICLASPVFLPANFAQVRGRSGPTAGHARRSVVRCGSRAGQPVAAARDGRGSLLPASAVISLQDGRRRLDADAQEARP